MDRQLVRIYELKLELLRLGYQGFQIDVIQRGVIGDCIPEEAAQVKRVELIASLEKYAYFARKGRVGCGRRFGPDT